jgi:hypothetical protein
MDDLESLNNKLLKTIELIERDKTRELEVITNIAQSEIQLVTPVGTDPTDKHKGLLKKSITHKMINSNTSEVGPGQEAYYAEAVNNGHMKRNVKVTDKSAYRGIRKHNPGGFVKGRHFMEKGIQNANPKMEKELHNWLENIIKEAGE